MKYRFALFTLILSLVCIGNSSNTNSFCKVKYSYLKDNLETLDAKFLLRVLPDNSWSLKLNKDSTYEYIHWSGWSENDGRVLEKGKYSFENNILRLFTDKKSRELTSRKFSLKEVESENNDENKKIDCTESSGKIYCLYKINNR